MPERKPLSNEARSLLGSLISDGEKLKRAAREAKVAERLRTKTVYDRNSTGSILADLFAEANTIVSDWHKQPGWKPVSRLTYIIHQHCTCCDGITQSIGNQFTCFTRKAGNGSIERRFSPELVVQDDMGLELPHETEIVVQEVRECASCIVDLRRLQRFITDVLKANAGETIAVPPQHSQTELPFRRTKPNE